MSDGVKDREIVSMGDNLTAILSPSFFSDPRHLRKWTTLHTSRLTSHFPTVEVSMRERQLPLNRQNE